MTIVEAGPPSSCVIGRVVSTGASEWDAFVQASAAAAPYHLWAWRGVFEDVFGHECVYLAAWRDGRMAGVLPLVKFRSHLFGRSLVSLPFVNYGGVVASDARVAQELLDAACQLATAFRGRHVELRHDSRHYPLLPCRQHKVSMRLPLDVLADDLWTRLDRKVRNQVRKAQQSGLTTIEGGVELVPAFYEVFAHNMRDLGTPVYDRRLFERVLAQFPQHARIFVVKSGPNAVAAALTYRFRDTVEVPWASSLREHRALCPNMLLYWEMLSSAIAAGCAEFDFGRSTPGEGTYHFKKQWGAVPRALYWEYAGLDGRAVPDQGPTNPRFNVAIRAWQRLPLSVATRLGPRIVRHIA